MGIETGFTKKQKDFLHHLTMLLAKVPLVFEERSGKKLVVQRALTFDPFPVAPT